jgi:hypothetical protein
MLSPPLFKCSVHSHRTACSWILHCCVHEYRVVKLSCP